MQKIISMFFLVLINKNILFIPSKTCYFYTNVFSNNNDVNFNVGGIKINSSKTLKYLGLKFSMKKNMFVIDVKDRILKFNADSYEVLLNAEGL